jgi:hypothetical protein
MNGIKPLGSSQGTAAFLKRSYHFAATNLINNFGPAYTYEFFITLGLLTAVPLSGSMHENNASAQKSVLITNDFSRSRGHCAVRGQIRRHGVVRHDFDHDRLLFGILPGQLARLHNQTA